MSQGTWTGTASSAVIVAADQNRDFLVIQKTNDLTVSLGIGIAAVAGEGVQLDRAGDCVRLRGAQARKAVYVIGLAGTGTYQTGDVEFVPGGKIGGHGSSTAITITLTSLSNGVWRQSTAVVDVGASGDVFIGGKIKSGGSTGAGDYVDLYVSASTDGGTTYGGGCSGAEGPYTPTNQSANLIFLGRIATPAASTTYEFGPFSLAAAFGGKIPERWVLVVDNESDDDLSSTASDNAIYYRRAK